MPEANRVLSITFKFDLAEDETNEVGHLSELLASLVPSYTPTRSGIHDSMLR